MRLMSELLALWLLKWYTVRIRTQLGIYGQIYPFAFRSSLGLRPRELLQAKGYIWPYIPPLVLIRIQYTRSLYSTPPHCTVNSVTIQYYPSMSNTLCYYTVQFVTVQYTLLMYRTLCHYEVQYILLLYNTLSYCTVHFSTVKYTLSLYSTV